MEKIATIHFENGSTHQVYLKTYDDITMIVKGKFMEGNYENRRIYFNIDQESKEILPNETFKSINGNVVEIMD